MPDEIELVVHAVHSEVARYIIPTVLRGLLELPFAPNGIEPAGGLGRKDTIRHGLDAIQADLVDHAIEKVGNLIILVSR